MKKAKLLVLSLLAVTAMSLTACSTTNKNKSENVSSENETSQNADTSSQKTSSQGGNASSSEAEQNVILCAKTSNGTVTADKKMAAAGETITLTITPDSGYMLSSLKVNEVSITGTSFVMPAESAYITATFKLISETNMMIKGDINVNLTPNTTTGVLEAKNVYVANDSKIYFSVDGVDYGVTAINNYKTFANIDLPTSNEKGFKISGGSTYDFYFDPLDSEEPISIQRVKVNELPNSAEALETMFGGRVKSETCMYPSGVTGVKYKSSEREDDYEWNLYSDNSSLATVKDLFGTEKGYVYKSIDDNVYTVVDNYIEDHDGHCITYVELDDTEAFSGKYEVVNTVAPGHSKYQRTTKAAENDANLYSHTMESIDFDIMYAYRTGFSNDISDDEYKYDIKVTSTANADGGFTTVIDSWVSVKASGSSSTSGGVDESYHNEYDVTIVFTEAGALKSLTYAERDYTASQYDFSSQSFIGSKESNPSSRKNVTCEYTYGTKKEGKPVFDTTPYFINNISDLSIVDSKGETSSVERMDNVSLFTTATEYTQSGEKFVKMKYEPSTALDLWQYGIESTSDRSVINNKNNDAVSYPYTFVGNGAGTTTLTIGNHTTNTGVKSTIDVTVAAQVGNVKSIYMNTVYPYTKDDNWTADKGVVYAGTKDTVKIDATLTNNSPDHNADLTATSSNPEILAVSYDKTTGYLTLDATKNAAYVTEQTEITVTFDASWDTSWNGQHSITIYVLPSAHLIDSVVGTWNYENSDAELSGSLTFSDKAGTVDTSAKTGSFSAKYVHDGTTDVFEGTFEYKFDKNSQSLKVVSGSVTITLNGEKISSPTFMLDYDLGDSGYVLCHFDYSDGWTESTEESDATETIHCIFGSIEDDEDYTEYTYAGFILA